MWKINYLKDPYIEGLQTNFSLKEKKRLLAQGKIKGFIASVEKPSHLKILTADERVGVDLFVNGRLREKDVLKHIPTARVVESYLYGQVHFDDLNDSNDRFTSSREGVVADDPKYKRFLELLKSQVMGRILEDWDLWRRKHKEPGDPENMTITLKARKAQELFDVVSKEYSLPKDSKNRTKVDGWVEAFLNDAKYNFPSYAECFISENLIRKYIQEKRIPLSPEAKKSIDKHKDREARSKADGNINIDIRHAATNLNYLDIKDLANLVDKQDSGQNCLPYDAKQYTPIRDAMMHTALLTDQAKRKMTSVYDNMHGRIVKLLSEK